MKNLRSNIIRLAHEKPELRDHLLPLVTKKASGNLCRPEPIQFVTRSELELEVQSSIDDVFHNWGSATVEKVVERNGVVHVRGSFLCQIVAHRQMLYDIIHDHNDLGSKMPKWNWRMIDTKSFEADYAMVKLSVSVIDNGLVLECYASRPEEVVRTNNLDPQSVKINKRQLDSLKITKRVGHYDDLAPTLQKMDKAFRASFRKLTGN